LARAPVFYVGASSEWSAYSVWVAVCLWHLLSVTTGQRGSPPDRARHHRSVCDNVGDFHQPGCVRERAQLVSSLKGISRRSDEPRMMRIIRMKNNLRVPYPRHQCNPWLLLLASFRLVAVAN